MEQHEKLVETEPDPEFCSYLQMLWETGGSQTDVARLHRRNVDLENRVLTYSRQKLEALGQGHAAIAIGTTLWRLLEERPKEGYLFPLLAPQAEKIRASRFRKRADRLGFTDVRHIFGSSALTLAGVGRIGLTTGDERNGNGGADRFLEGEQATF